MSEFPHTSQDSHVPIWKLASGQRIRWIGSAILLILLPQVFPSGASLSLMSQIGSTMILCMSYNMLLGQGGLLSFGHTVYSGLGAYVAIHAMNLAGHGDISLPLVLVPLVGGIAGAMFGLVFGYVTTRKAGTAFAMITLGMVELVYHSSLMFPEFFGGEGGITTNRVYGKPLLGITFGPQVQVYYLIAVWLFLSVVAIRSFTLTPLGRMVNAMRDNAERVEFVGYDAQWLRYLLLIASAFFAGVAGGLNAINFEIVTAENVSALRAGTLLLFVFIGGAAYFYGPLLGALVGVLLTVCLSDYTKAWQLYLGLFFIWVVMYAPNGLASLLQPSLWYSSVRQRGWKNSVLFLMWIVCALAGGILLIEMTYHLQLESDTGDTVRVFWREWSVRDWRAWGCGLVLVSMALAGLLRRRGHPIGSAVAEGA